MTRAHTYLSLVLLSTMASGCSNDVVRQSDNKTTDIEALKTRLETPSAEDVFVVAHRACWRETAENALSAIDACVDLAVDMIEIDVRKTADAELVVIHDDTVDRTTDGSGKVADMTLADLRQLSLRSGAGGDDSQVLSEQIPTLKEALSATKDRILVNLDVKADLYDQVFEVVDEVGVADQILMKMSADADDAELRDAQFLGRTYFMPILRECDAERPDKICWPVLSHAVGAYADYDPIAFEIVNQTDEYLLEGVQSVRQMGVRLWVNTLGPRFAAGRSDDKSLEDPDGNWGYLVDHGVDMIQTDRPAALIEYLESRGSRVEQ